MITRRGFLATGLAAFAASDVGYSFAVFGLLHPTKLNVYAVGTGRLHSGGRIIEGQQPVAVEAGTSVTGPNGGAVWFTLEAPGVLTRRYFGTLQVTREDGVLYPVVTMDREVAVGSIVGAELPVRGTPGEALAAQAVAVRSFLIAERMNRRHDNAQFCDTTHCQFLRAPASEGSKVDRAVKATTGLVLSFGERVITAHYSTSCGGRTTEGEFEHYQYRSVICEPCRSGHVARKGPGLGMCQTGAIGLAKEGWAYRKILEHYYPGTVIRSI